MVLAGLLIAGCGSAPSATPVSSAAPGSPLALSEVVDATLGAGTARVQVRVRGGTGGPLVATGTMKGAVEFASGNWQLLVSLPFGGARVETRLVDGAVYTQVPAGAHGSAGGERWVEVASGTRAGAPLLEVGDPTSGLSLLRDAAGPLTEIGREQVRDADTTHYRAELDVPEQAVPSPSTDRSRVEKGEADELRLSLGGAPLPVELWIDDRQRLRRLQLALPSLDVPRPRRGAAVASSGPSASISSGSTSTVEYYDFGVELHVQSPPADQVLTFPEPPRVPRAPANASPSAS